MKHLLFSILVLALLSCSKDEPEKPNTPPNSFEVTAKVDGTDVTLTWTEAVDAEGDAVTYAVVYGDTLAKGLTARTFTIKNLPYETEISGTVVASDGKGGKTESGFNVKTSENPYVMIPDKNFESALVALKIDDVVDGKVSRNLVVNVKDLNLESKNIRDLTGIEAFTNLIKLNLKFNSLKILNVTSNEKLEELNCAVNEIETLYLGEKPKIRILHIGVNKFKEIDLRHVKDLVELDAFLSAELKKVHLDSKALKHLQLGACKLESLDLSSVENLEFLDCYDNNLSKLDLTRNKKLNTLRIPNNSFQDLDLSGNISLETLDADYNKFETIDISKNSNLSTLRLSSNVLQVLNVSNNRKLSLLHVSNNKLEQIDLTYCEDLRSLECQLNQLKTLNLALNTKLNTMNCTNNNLTIVCVKSLNQPIENSWYSWKKDATATYKVCD